MNLPSQSDATYAVGFTFTDNLWGDESTGEITGLDVHGRWTVRWSGGPMEFTSETDETITDMIRGVIA